MGCEIKSVYSRSRFALGAALIALLGQVKPNSGQPSNALRFLPKALVLSSVWVFALELWPNWDRI